uniref:Homeobox domain-containing protein n=1 Tax=Mesocestoides corti TaxID=53468 RepID=A0A5K3FIU7_MESCO
QEVPSDLSERAHHSFTIDAILRKPWYSRQADDNSTSPCSPSRLPLDANNAASFYATVGFTNTDEVVSPDNAMDVVSKTCRQSPPATRCPLIGRSPRVPFTRGQVEGLEAKFRATNYLSSREVTMLANQLNVTETRVRM